jgi:hypothetical protein
MFPTPPSSTALLLITCLALISRENHYYPSPRHPLYVNVRSMQPYITNDERSHLGPQPEGPAMGSFSAHCTPPHLTNRVGRGPPDEAESVWGVRSSMRYDIPLDDERSYGRKYMCQRHFWAIPDQEFQAGRAFMYVDPLAPGTGSSRPSCRAFQATSVFGSW